jgi:hypothetical protein
VSSTPSEKPKKPVRVIVHKRRVVSNPEPLSEQEKAFNRWLDARKTRKKKKKAE